MILYEDMWDRARRECPFYAALRAFMDLYGDMKIGRLLTIPNFISMYSPSKSQAAVLPGSVGLLPSNWIQTRHPIISCGTGSLNLFRREYRTFLDDKARK